MNELIVGKIQTDMERQFPEMQLRCTMCGRIESNDWAYLCSGWPECCGYTMTLERKGGSDE